jgi:hypothetical protein
MATVQAHGGGGYLKYSAEVYPPTLLLFAVKAELLYSLANEL